MAIKLKDTTVENMKPGGKRQEVADALMPGLYLVVQPSGKKAWAVRYRAGGKPRKLTIAPYPAMSLKDAREQAAAALREVALGNDPAQAKAEARQVDNTVRHHFSVYAERHLANLRQGQEVERVFNRDVLPAWRERDIDTIRKKDVIALIDGIADRGSPIAANRALAYVRAWFNWLVSRDVIADSPAKGVKPPAAERKKDRVLSDDEVRWFWAATEHLGQPFAPLFRLLLLTGQRRNEIAQLTDADLNETTIQIPAARAKNKKAHAVALTDLMREEIDGLIRIAGCSYLFTTMGQGPVQGLGKPQRRVIKYMEQIATKERGEQVEIPHWTLHDLRRTMASGLARLGIPPHVTEAVQNRASGAVSGVAAIYQRHDYGDEKRAALEAWSRFVRDLVEGPEGNVVSIGGRK